MSIKILERSRATASTVDAKSGRLKIRVISPGWGSSGYYSETVLKNAADAKVFPAGTKMFFDHASESERRDRPERSVLDLAATTTQDAYWDDEAGGLVAETQVFAPYRGLLTDEDFAETIGTSIVAWADTTIGEAEGRKGTIITELTASESVDFVTWPGAGGAILQVLESARPEAISARAIERGVDEATANDVRSWLTEAVRAAYGAEDRYVWLLDFDDTKAWFTVETEVGSQIYEQGYALSGVNVSLADGDPTPVRRVVSYVPMAAESATPAAPSGPTNAPAPAGQSTAITQTEESHMATTQIDEVELDRIRQDAERVPTLESERDTATRRAHTAEATLAAVRILHREAATVTVSSVEERGLLADLPLTEAGALDEAAYAATVQAFVAEKAEAAGAGKVTGFGSTAVESTTGGDPWAEIDTRLNIGKGA